MAILEVKNMNKTFGGTHVLKDIDFVLEENQVLAIIGSSGGGKTTLLRCINFLETPEEGEMWIGTKKIFDGKESRQLSESQIRANRLHFGLVFQSFNLFPQYTALGNVMLARQLEAKAMSGYKNNKKAVDEEIKEQARELLMQMGLEDRMDNYPHQLSGGQCQRVAIARALAMSPDILCFDEPTSALDPELTGEVLRVIKELGERDTTMIIVTHEMAFAREVADKILFMDDGRIVEEGSPENIFEHPKSERLQSFLQSMIRA